MSDSEDKAETRDEPVRRRDEDEEERKAAVEEEKKRRKEMLEKRKADMQKKSERRAEERKKDEDEPPSRRSTATEEKEKPKKKKVVERDEEEEEEVEKKPKKKAIREDLVQNAVYFLNSPTVKNTPLAKKVAFMEKKGLTSAEIKEALRRATVSKQDQDDDDEDDQPQQQVVPQRRVRAAVPRAPGSYPPPPPPPPPPQGPSWRGVATAAALVVGVGGGVTYLAKHFLIPHLWPSKQQDDPVNQSIKDLKDQMAQISQNSNDLKDALAAITNANSQQQQLQQQIQSMIQQQVQQQVQQIQSKPAQHQEWNHDYDVLQPPQVPDPKDKENAELKQQIAVLKATLSARQPAASAVPSYPNARTSFNWSPTDQASTIPSWQKNLSSPSRSTNSPSPNPPQIQPIQSYQRPQTPQGTTHTQQPPQTPPQPSPQISQPQTTSQSTQPPVDEAPHSSAFTNVLQLVQDKSLSKDELHRRLDIKDINDKPVGNAPVTKGSRQPGRKPWEVNTTTTTTSTSTSSDTHEDGEQQQQQQQEQQEHNNEEKKVEAVHEGNFTPEGDAQITHV